MNRRILLPILAGVIVCVPSSASACAVCMGDPNSNIAVATISVLWTMLALVGFIFAATGCTAWYLWRRSKMQLPPHIELVESLHAEPEES
ncbi:MAG: hypothetical protein ABI318_21890 [Chthoniobacteraceae bacterium]